MTVEFTEFVVSRTPALLRFAYLLSGDRYLAEDLTQEALVRVHRRWSSIVRTDGPEPYVRKAILRQYLSWYRRRASTEVPRAEAPDRPDPRSLADRVVEQDEMWSMLATLPRMQRAVLVLRFLEGLDVSGVAGVLGCTEGTVKSQTARGLATLRAELGDALDDLRPAS